MESGKLGTRTFIFPLYMIAERDCWHNPGPAAHYRHKPPPAPPVPAKPRLSPSYRTAVPNEPNLTEPIEISTLPIIPSPGQRDLTQPAGPTPKPANPPRSHRPARHRPVALLTYAYFVQIPGRR